jgi:hypothetical protein
MTGFALDGVSPRGLIDRLSGRRQRAAMTSDIYLGINPERRASERVDGTNSSERWDEQPGAPYAETLELGIRGKGPGHNEPSNGPDD